MEKAYASSVHTFPLSKRHVNGRPRTRYLFIRNWWLSQSSLTTCHVIFHRHADIRRRQVTFRMPGHGCRLPQRWKVSIYSTQPRRECVTTIKRQGSHHGKNHCPSARDVQPRSSRARLPCRYYSQHQLDKLC